MLRLQLWALRGAESLLRSWKPLSFPRWLLLRALVAIGTEPLFVALFLGVLTTWIALIVVFAKYWPPGLDFIIAFSCFVNAFHAARRHWFRWPAGIGVAAVYGLLAYHDNPLAIFVWLASYILKDDDIWRWLGKKLGAAKSSLTAIQQMAFRREARASR